MRIIEIIDRDDHVTVITSLKLYIFKLLATGKLHLKFLALQIRFLEE